MVAKSAGAIPVTVVTLILVGLGNAFSPSSRPPGAGTAGTSKYVTQPIPRRSYGPGALPLPLFGLGGGGESSKSRSSAGGASKARRAIESNTVFRSRIAKVREVYGRLALKPVYSMATQHAAAVAVLMRNGKM